MVQYVDKDAILAEIERRIKGLKDCHADTIADYAGEISGLERLLSFIDTIEVKEVDLENNMTDINFEEEIDNFMYGTRNPERFPNSVQVRDKHTGLTVLDWKSYVSNPKHKIEFAKYFFELGFNTAQKGGEK